MTEQPKNCLCGAADCWPEGDTAWLASESGWYGELHGCQSAVFFIHGKKVREQRRVPFGTYPVEDLPRLFAKWSTGLPGAALIWSAGSEDGDSSLWIDGVREPNAEDWRRLDDCRQRQLEKDTRELAWLQKRIVANQVAGTARGRGETE